MSISYVTLNAGSVVIGVGGAGCRIASKLGAALSMDRVYVSPDECELNFSGYKIHLPYEGGGKGRLLSSFYEKAEELKSAIKGRIMCFVVGSLGGLTGSTLVPEVAKLAASVCGKVVSICVMPSPSRSRRTFRRPWPSGSSGHPGRSFCSSTTTRSWTLGYRLWKGTSSSTRLS